MPNAFVYVIESPSATDLLDGRTEGRALSEALRLSEIPHWYSLASTEEAFSEALSSRLRQAMGHAGLAPIIHLSMHGNQNGVALTDGTFMSWHSLRTHLRPINEAMNGGLLIGMSSCLGAAGCRMAMHEDNERPFWALVGNTATPTWADSAVAFITFYHLFFKNVFLPDCVERMKLASCDANFVYFAGEHVRLGWVDFMTHQRGEQLAEALTAASYQQPGEAEA